MVFWSLSCYKELKLTTNPFTGRTLHGLLIQMQNIGLRSSGMRRKQNFLIVFEFISDTAVLTFTFRFLSSPLFSLFLPHFFSLAGHLVGFILVGRVLGKLLGGQWKKIFMEIYRSILLGFLPFPPVSLTELCSFWNGLKDLFTLHKLMAKLALTIKTDDVMRGRKDVNPQGRLRVVQGQMG